MIVLYSCPCVFLRALFVSLLLVLYALCFPFYLFAGLCVPPQSRPLCYPALPRGPHRSAPVWHRTGGASGLRCNRRYILGLLSHGSAPHMWLANARRRPSPQTLSVAAICVKYSGYGPVSQGNRCGYQAAAPVAKVCLTALCVCPASTQGSKSERGNCRPPALNVRTGAHSWAPVARCP